MVTGTGVASQSSIEQIDEILKEWRTPANHIEYLKHLLQEARQEEVYYTIAFIASKDRDQLNRLTRLIADQFEDDDVFRISANDWHPKWTIVECDQKRLAIIDDAHLARTGINQQARRLADGNYSARARWKDWKQCRFDGLVLLVGEDAMASHDDLDELRYFYIADRRDDIEPPPFALIPIKQDDQWILRRGDASTLADNEALDSPA